MNALSKTKSGISAETSMQYIEKTNTYSKTNRKYSIAVKKNINKKMITNYYNIIYYKVHKINVRKKILHRDMKKILHNSLIKLMLILKPQKTKSLFWENEPGRIISGFPFDIRVCGENSILILRENIEKNRKYSIKPAELENIFYPIKKNIMKYCYKISLMSDFRNHGMPGIPNRYYKQCVNY